MQATLNTLVGIVLVGLDLAFVWATKLTIDVATHQSERLSLTACFVVLAAVMLVRIAVGLNMRWIRAILGVRAQNAMRRALFGRLLHCRWTALKAYHTGNLTNRIERDVSDVVNFSTESVPSFLTTLVQFLGAFFFLFFMDSTLAVIVVCIVPFFILSSKLYVKKMRALSHETREQESRIQSLIQETLQHVLIVKTLQRVEFFLKSLGGTQDELHQTVIRRTRYSTLSAALMGFGFGCGYFVTFAWGAYSLSEGMITYGAMIAFVQLVAQIQNPVRNLSKFIPIFIAAFTAAERLMDLEDIALEEDEPAAPLPSAPGIRLSDVTFQYTPQSRRIFDGFSYVIPPGSVTAIVGETGAGKTTFIRLLLALVQPQDGKISLFTEEKGDVEMLPAQRTNFAYVPQGNTLFSGTIRSNLLLGNPDATEEQMAEALRCAAGEFVFRKPLGLDSPCGEAGDGLSEGQAQRIGIARALLSDGNIFIFDEATSSLDADTERLVLQRIVERCKGRTLLFITHRPEVLKYATQQLKLYGKK